MDFHLKPFASINALLNSSPPSGWMGTLICPTHASINSLLIKSQKWRAKPPKRDVRSESRETKKKGVTHPSQKVENSHRYSPNSPLAPHKPHAWFPDADAAWRCCSTSPSPPGAEGHWRTPAENRCLSNRIRWSGCPSCPGWCLGVGKICLGLVGHAISQKTKKNETTIAIGFLPFFRSLYLYLSLGTEPREERRSGNLQPHSWRCASASFHMLMRYLANSWKPGAALPCGLVAVWRLAFLTYMHPEH